MPRVQVVPRKHRRDRDVASTQAPRRLRAIGTYMTGPFLEERLLGQLSGPVLEGFEKLSSPVSHPKGAILFIEGQEAKGVFLLRKGRVKLSANAADGKMLLLRIAEPGEIIGMPGALSRKTYVLTAEALEPVDAHFIPREPFVRFLRDNGEAALRVAEILNEIYHATFQEVRNLGLSGSATEKLARFLLDATAAHELSSGPHGASLALTHEEIAETLGIARETVTRIFASFKRQRLIEVRGSSLVITNRTGLERLLRA